MPWFVYIVQCSDQSLYVGITYDLGARIAKHNKGTGAKYTRSRRPVTLLKTFLVPSKSEALKLEHKLKQMSRQEKLALCYQST